nr:MAG TPA_asm: hypothetical protein [Caudoviricetes sp.]
MNFDFTQSKNQALNIKLSGILNTNSHFLLLNAHQEPRQIHIYTNGKLLR